MSRASHSRRHPRGLSPSPLLALFLLLLPALALAQIPQTPPASARARFAAARTVGTGIPTAPALARARAGNASLAAARASALATNPSLAPLSAAWTPAGPAAIQSLQFGAISGRVTALALDPADPSGNTLFVGTAGGGLWKSINAAGPSSQVTFTPLTDTLPVFSPSAGSSLTPSLSIGALAALPGGLLLAGTGDPNDADDSFYGTGLLRSADSGLTWSLITQSNDGVAGTHSFFGLGFAAVASSTASPNLLVAAVSQSEEGQLVGAAASASTAGLYVSADSGLTWRLATVLDGAATVLTPLPNGGNHGGIAATSVVWNPVRQRFFAALRYHGYYQSADGATWTRLPVQPGSGLTSTACPALRSSTACPIFRGTLAVQPLTGDTFVLTTDRNNRSQGLLQDVCQSSGSACAASSPLFANPIATAPLETAGTIAQADYNLSLAALPSPSPTTSADTILFVGTTDLFRCSLSSTGATACTLRNTTNAANGCAAPARVSPAQHSLALGGPATAPLLFLGNDGGLWRSTDTVNQQATPCSADDASHFQNLNLTLGSLAEVVSFAQHPADPAILLAGLGASGTVSTGRADQTAWQQLSSGEGGSVAIDPTNPALWYLSTAAGISLASCGNGAACTAADLLSAPIIGPAQVASDLALLDAPSLLDPAFPGTLITGSCRVWRGPAALPALWSTSNRISPALAGPQNSSCATTNGLLRSLAAGGPATAAGSQVLYAGLAGTLAGGGTLGGHLFATTSAATASATIAWSDRAASPVSNDPLNLGLFNPGGFSLSSITVDPHDSTGRTVYVTIQGFHLGTGSVPHLYGSTDAGLHWTNLSANLPAAPANALVVDPNDANTVYIALDTGVYATTTITACATTNCWTLFGTTLPDSPVTALAAAPAMPTGDGRLGLLRAGTYGRGLWQIPLLSAATVQQPAITLSPASLAFGSQAVGTVGVAQTVVVTNTGTAALLVSRIALGSNNLPVGVQAVVTDFTETDTCTAVSIAPGATCSLSVGFLPSAIGQRSSTLTLFANVPGGQATVALLGTATAPAAVQLAPSALAFPATSLSAGSAPQTLLLQNTGGSPVSITSVTLNGTDFQLALNTCSVSLAPQTSCTLSLIFRPAALGARSATVTVVDSLGTQTATLSGIATAPATDALSASSFTFPTTQVGAVAASQQLILTNAGDVALTLITASVTGAASSDFSVTNSCGNSLAAHSACAIAVAFNPHTVGASAATLLVADVYRTQTITLAGTGIAPPGISLLPASTIVFPATGLGVTSATQRLTLTNNGGLSLLISSVTLAGDFQLAATGSTCGVSLAPGTACTIAVVFAPTASGLRTGALTIVDNAPASRSAPVAGQQSVPLTGTGVDFALAADGPTILAVASGKSATFPLLLSTPAALPGALTLACTGAPANSVCTLSPATISPGTSGPTLITVTLATGQSTTTATAAALFGAPTLGTPTLGTPTFGLPTLGTPTLGTPTLGTPTFGLPTLGLSTSTPPQLVISTSAPSQSVISNGAQHSGETPVFALLHATSRASAHLHYLRAATKATLALLFPLGFLSLRRRGSLPTLLALTLVALLPLAGCGSAPRQIPGAATTPGTAVGNATPTPSGTYTLTVTATSAGLSRSIDLVVTVQ